MIGFIDDQRVAHGGESICRVLQIAPSTYYACLAVRADPANASARQQQDVIFHAPETMTAVEAAQFEAFLRERWNAPDVPENEWTTIASATRAIAELRAQAGTDQEALDDIAAFIRQMTFE